VREPRQYASCFVDDLLFGIRVEQVQEVTDRLNITPVPLAPAAVRGLLNLRGQILTAIDLRRCLQLNERSAGNPPVHMILRTDERAVSLLVDRIGGVVVVDDADFELPPSTLRGRSRELILGAYKIDQGLLLALDSDALLRRIADLGSSTATAVHEGSSPLHGRTGSERSRAGAR
jgi:purine-binding chemotaxis protein CheW